MGYWEERQAKALKKLTDKSIADIEKELKRYYNSASKKIIGQFEQTYNKVFSSIVDGKQPTPADLYKLDKYWQMQGQLKQELQKLGDKQIDLLSKKFFSQYHQIYEAIALETDLSFGTINREAAMQVINSVWCADGKNWSSRIWTNTDLLQQTLNDNLIDCVITGKKPSELKEILQERFNVGFNNADTLVRTEMTHIQTQAAQQRYKDYGIEEVEVLVDEDERTCSICAKMEGKRYPINAQIPIPFHPRCRCCVTPVLQKKELEIFSSGDYNGYTACFDDKVNFDKNRDVQKAIKSENANFVRLIEPTNQIEYGEIFYGIDIEKTPKLSGYYDVKAHGDFQSIKLFNTPINAETLAKILISRNDYKQGTPIRLLSCNTGDNSSGVCFAQDLANMLNTEVIAPDFTLFVDGQGRLYRGRGCSVRQEDFKHFYPQSNKD